MTDYNNIIIEGKSIAEWMKPDLDFIDYSNTTFFANVSTDKAFTVYYLGQYEYDPDVKDTTYHNGLDLARIAACSECHAPYNNMFADYPLTGDSLVRIFFNHYPNANIADYIERFFNLGDGDVFIGRNLGIYVIGREFN